MIESNSSNFSVSCTDAPGLKTNQLPRPSRIDIAAAIMRIALILASWAVYLVYQLSKFEKSCLFMGLMLLTPCLIIAFKIHFKLHCDDASKLHSRLRLLNTIGLILFSVFYVLHIITYGNLDVISRELVSSACLLFFVWVLYESAPGFVKALAGRTSYAGGLRVGEKNRFWHVIAIALIIRIVVTLIGMLIYDRLNTNVSFSSPFALWQGAWSKGNTDVNHYLNIAENWYVASGNDRLLIVFFPLFPILIRVLNLIIGNSFISAQLINTVFSCLAAGMLYKVIRGWFSEQNAFFASILFLLLPGSIFMYSPMTEPLFMLLSCCCFYFAQKKNYLIAGLFAGLAGFTRSVGILLAVPIAVEGVTELIHCAREKRKAMGKLFMLIGGLVISTLGTLAYLGINKAITGNAFMFLEYQKSNWYQSISFFFDTPRYMLDQLHGNIMSSDIISLVSFSAPTLLTIFVSLLIYSTRAERLPASLNAYFIVYFIITVGCTWLLSAVRYMSVAIPLIAAIALIPKSRKGRIALISITALSHLVFVAFYMLRWSLF